MHPKTFQVMLRQPLGQSCTNPFILYIHQQTARDALQWVASTFPGVDIRPTLAAWANPPKGVSVGNRRPVTIIDCDHFVKRKRVGAKYVAEPTPLGTFRRAEEAVTEDLQKVFQLLHEAHRNLSKAFVQLKRHYLECPTEHRYKQLEDVKLGAERAQQWMANVWNQYQARMQVKSAADLTMPQASHRQPLAA